jgi:hypothetical protein
MIPSARIVSPLDVSPLIRSCPFITGESPEQPEAAMAIINPAKIMGRSFMWWPLMV